MTSLLLALALAQAPQQGTPAPARSETAKLFFLTGDLAKALEIARTGTSSKTSDGKKCKALLKPLAEYAFLANHLDEFTPEQAKQFLALDRQIVPKGRGKLTQKAVDRYVDKPLSIAKLRAEAGDLEGATAISKDVLAIDPKHAETLAFLKSLSTADGGVPASRDGGQSKPR